jgi:DNA polymerase I
MHYTHTLVLLDMYALLHRSYHALPDFRSSGGEPTGALYGVATMILKLQETFAPEYIIGCFDLPGGTFRTALDASYKATRTKTDDDLIVQINRSKELLTAFGIPYYEQAGFEADDLLGTLAVHHKQDPTLKIIIVTGDMDTLQLVDRDQVVVYTLKKGITDTIIYDEQAVIDRYGFAPTLLPDYKGLRGDPSDNIIGIKGIGEKTASLLVATFGTLESLYERISANDPRFASLITPRILGLITEGQEEAFFSKTLARIVTDAPIVLSLPVPWSTTRSLSTIEAMCRTLEFRALIKRIDTVFANKTDAPTRDVPASTTTPDPAWIRDGAPQELITIKVIAWLLDQDNTDPHLESIPWCATSHTYQNAFDRGIKLLEQKSLLDVFRHIEEPVLPITEAMKHHGIHIDPEHFISLKHAYEQELKSLETLIHGHIGGAINIKSPKQLSQALFGDLGLPTKGIKKSAQGYSTDSTTLEKLRDIHPVVSLISTYREWQKLLSTYIEPLLEAQDEHHCVHSTFIQYGTTTGRFSSEKPNMQNIPAHGDKSLAIKRGFVARSGYMFVACDFSQMELRLAALLSQDQALIDIFKKGQDIHSAVAGRVFGVPEKDVTKDMRRQAKVINFGILYGMGATALQKNLGTTRSEATAFIQQYFQAFSGLASYLETTKQEAYTHGHTTTLFGRIRPLPGIRSKIPFIKAMNERIATNAPIQGTEADMMKLGAEAIDRYTREHGYTDAILPILQIHDELVFEIKNELVDTVLPDIQNILQNILATSYKHIDSPIPFPVNIATGSTLGTLEKKEIV